MVFAHAEIDSKACFQKIFCVSLKTDFRSLKFRKINDHIFFYAINTKTVRAILLFYTSFGSIFNGLSNCVSNVTLAFIQIPIRYPKKVMPHPVHINLNLILPKTTLIWFVGVPSCVVLCTSYS